MHRFLSISFVLAIGCLILVTCNKAPFVNISVDTIKVPAQGGSIGFSFSTNCEWVLTSSANWCSYEATPLGGEVSVVLVCGMNTSFEPRECTLSIEAGGIGRTVKVIQDQTNALELNMTKYEASPDGETLVVKLSHNVDYSISISDSWIRRVNSKSYVTENVSFEIEPNYTDLDRQGVISVSSQDKTIIKSIAVHQKKKIWAVESVQLNYHELNLLVGDSEQLIATVLPENATDKTVRWMSDNPSIVEVSETGSLTAKRIGTAIISAKAGDITDNCVCSVLDYRETPTDLSLGGTANCYIVPKKGVYKFKAVKGNSQQMIEPIDHAYVVWRTLNTTTHPSHGSIVIDPIFRDGYIVFSTGEDYTCGNALIAAVDKNNTILWSWHFWVTDADIEGLKHTYANDAGVLMDRNLGALSAAVSDPLTIGLLYQWGRKDPFLASASLTETVEMASDYSWPRPIEVFNQGSSLVDYSIQNPTTYITSNSGMRDWQAVYEENVDQKLWYREKTVYDPCPPGWRVPDGGPEGIWVKAGIPEDGNLGYLGLVVDKKYSGKDAWYPAADCRLYHSGALNTNMGVWGRYWSCTKYFSDNPYIIQFPYYDKWVFIFEFNSEMTRIEGHSPVPAGAYSVRCCKE